MQQVLFHVPILKDTFPPDGIPVHGFGVMLFVLGVRVATSGGHGATSGHAALT